MIQIPSLLICTCIILSKYGMNAGYGNYRVNAHKQTISGAVDEDWNEIPVYKIFQGDDQWNLCPDGYSLSGFWRSQCDQLSCIERMKCVSPAHDPSTVIQTDCYDQGFYEPHTSKGKVERFATCKPGYFVKGLKVKKNEPCVDDLKCIVGLRCCKYPKFSFTRDDEIMRWWN